jgi:hypothetical protein
MFRLKESHLQTVQKLRIGFVHFSVYTQSFFNARLFYAF